MRQKAARMTLEKARMTLQLSRNFRRSATSATSFRPTSLEIEKQDSNEVGRNEVGLDIDRRIQPAVSVDTSDFVTAQPRLAYFVPRTLSAKKT